MQKKKIIPLVLANLRVRENIGEFISKAMILNNRTTTMLDRESLSQ